MFREVYTQPLSDICQSSVGGIEKHVRSYPTLFIVDSFQVIKTDMGTI